MDKIVFDYQFKFDDGSQRNFRVELDANTMISIDDPNYQPPDWAHLDYHKCSHCPYSSDKIKYCPVAKNIARVAESFAADISYTETTVLVKTTNRFYGKRTDVQVGLQSLFGLAMSSADCSHMNFFKPMARHHLPFSTFEETVVRVLGMFLISEYLRIKNRGGDLDMELAKLVDGYAQVSIVNRGMINRIRALTKSKGDADKNAIVILDGFASMLPMELQAGLEQLNKIFGNAKKAA